MRKIPVKYIGLLALAALPGGLFHSCTESQQDIPDGVDSKSGIVLRTSVREETPYIGLLTKLYIFTNDGTGYQLSDSVPQVISGTTRLKMSYADLNKNDYRFLFVATPQSKPEICVKRSDDASFAFGTRWDKVVVAMQGDSLSVDNYYGITDLSGTEVMRLTSIEGELTRLVGQMVFCFYKTGPGGVKDPVAVDDKTVKSVLDRIFSLDITYEGIPLQVGFDGENKPFPVASLSKTVKHTIRFSQTEDSLRVILPQAGVPVEVADSIPGGAIVKGTCLLPSRQGVRVSMVFHYYDTTPICENADATHQHVASCYMPGTVSLRLPKSEESPGLNVLPDYFTISNAGLPCNRIIDVLHSSVIDVDMVWNDKYDKKE